MHECATMSRDVLVCPWHSFQFGLNAGEEACWKRPATLRMYAIEEIQSEVLVTV
jgi:nitrite reductase/ring-hydroxylating ferredoxin subunit